jgi:hypothetical protein
MEFFSAINFTKIISLIADLADNRKLKQAEAS